jgi:hypothetical protein
VSGYTIPGETRRPYTLVGRLSLGQAAWLGGAGVVVWRVLNAPWPTPARIIVAAAAAGGSLALTCVRWPVGETGEPAAVWIRRAVRFLASPRRMTVRRAVPLMRTLREIRAGTVRDGAGLLRILEVSATPFELRDPAEREALLAGYRGFLQALPGPVEIVSISERLRLDGYLARLKADALERGGRIGEQMAAHARFLEGLIHARHIMTRRHYVVLRRPCRDGSVRLQEALRQLGADEAAVSAALQGMGLTAHPLGDAELANLMRAAYLGQWAPLPAAPAAFATLVALGGHGR